MPAGTENSSQNVTLPEIPELYQSNFLDLLLPKDDLVIIDAEVTPPPRNPMITALQKTTQRTRTANHAPAYNTTDSSLLDAFHNLAGFIRRDTIDRHLTSAWAEDPQMTLRIIWNLRSIHDGKSDKELFYRAFGWLYMNHPRTAIANLPMLVEPVCTRHKSKEKLSHGYWKDLLNILVLVTLDELRLPSFQAPCFLRSRPPMSELKELDYGSRFRKLSYAEKDDLKRKRGAGDDEVSPRAASRRQVRKLMEAKAQDIRAKEAKKQKGQTTHNNLITKLADPTFRALYIMVARLFADHLNKNMNTLQLIASLPPDADKVPHFKKLTLVGKWAPSPHASQDRHTNISTAIALLLLHAHPNFPLPFPAARSTTPRSDPQFSHILRSYFQRWVHTSLRSALLIPESFMATNRWGQVRYNRVSSVCMKNNAEAFLKRDTARFEEYLIGVENGTKKISGATLLPHVIVAEALQLSSSSSASHWDPKGRSEILKNEAVSRHLAESRQRVVEGQWKTMIARLKESGVLDGTLAVCDVSGSMGCITGRMSPQHPLPILPAISLSLVLAQLAQPPFNDGFITFSAKPTYVRLDPAHGLARTVRTMADADWGYNTNLNAVFLDLLLPLAVENNMKGEDMIKRLFVFTDMQFDEGDGGGWETGYDVVERAYTEKGYEVPEVVYWNLGSNDGRMTVPVQKEKKGVALMSGFSPAMLKVFMGEQEQEQEGEKEEGEEMDTWEDVEFVEENKGGVVVSSAPVKTTQEDDFTPLGVMKKALGVKSFDGLFVVD